MKGLNRCQLIGNVTREPEVKYIPSGAPVAKFGLATSESFKNKQGNVTEKTEFHNIIAWNKLAEVIGEYVHKGGRLFIEGKIQTTSYDKDGQKKYFTEIVAENMIMMDGNGSKSSASEQPAAQTVPDDDIPF